MGLEPTAHRMGNLSRQGRESNPSPCQFQQLLPRSHRAYEREVSKFGVGQFPWPLGLLPCCDYSIHPWGDFVKHFSKKTFLFFFKKSVDKWLVRVYNKITERNKERKVTTMKQYQMSHHMTTDRLDRAMRIAQSIGWGEEYITRYRKENNTLEHLHDNGVLIVTDANDTLVITMYLVSNEEKLAFFFPDHRIPNRFYNTWKKSWKKFQSWKG